MKVIRFLRLCSLLVLYVILITSCKNNTDFNEVADWDQFRGPNRDGKSTETGLMKQWPENGPQQLWSVEGIGEGHSTVAISGGLILTTGLIDSTDYLTAYDMSGQQKWQIPYGKGWLGSFPGVRVTPTIEDGKVYIISGHGEISRVNLTDGKIEWTVDAYQKFEGKYETWGIAENLLIVDNKLIYTPAGDKTTMVALDKNSGETVWISESINDGTGYVSPILVNRGDKKLIINVVSNYIVAVNAATGTIEWKVNYSEIETPDEFPGAAAINCTIPIYKDGKIFVTSGYNHTGVMFNLSEDGSSVETAWVDTTLDNHHGGVVEVDGYLYGSNWIHNRKGNWVCQDWETGEVKYETEWETKGSILYADGMLYCYDEQKGNIALVKATPKEFKVVSQFQIKSGKGPHWAYPVIHNAVLYIRHGNTLSAFDVKAKS